MDGAARDGWHLDKKVSVGHIITTAMAVIAAVAAYSNIESRVSRLEERTEYIRADIRDIKAAVTRIEDKLDRKADKP